MKENRETSFRTHTRTHPWITFRVDLSDIPSSFWMTLGECQSKVEHLAGVPIKPVFANELHQIYLIRGVQATTAIEGNTLTEEQIKDVVNNKSDLAPSLDYLQQEVDNIADTYESIAKKVFEGEGFLLGAQHFHAIHKLIMKAIPMAGEEAGKVSRQPVGIPTGGYIGAPREDCNYLMDCLGAWLTDELPKQYSELPDVALAIVKAIVAHVYLAWIHPWADGNGRTARMIEFGILFASGLPTVAAHLLSNFYNQTRTEYYRQLNESSKVHKSLVPFLQYAVEGLRDGLRESIHKVRAHQLAIAWDNYVFEQFKGKKGDAWTRRRNLVFDLAGKENPTSTSKIPDLSPRLARAYAGKTPKTTSRDLNQLLKMKLIRKEKKGYVANIEIVNAFLPARVATSAD